MRRSSATVTQWAGRYHALLVQAALAGTVGFAVFFGALACSESSIAADGSVVAARLRDRLPGLGIVIASAAVWYAFAERVEPHHAGCPPLFAAAVLAACGVARSTPRGLPRRCRQRRRACVATRRVRPARAVMAPPSAISPLRSPHAISVPAFRSTSSDRRGISRVSASFRTLSPIGGTPCPASSRRSSPRSWH